MSFAPNTWKVGTLRSLIQRAYTTISSDAPALNVELEYLKKGFIELNGYPGNLVKNIMNAEHQKHLININRNQRSLVTENSDVSIEKPTMVIPYKGDRGSNLVKRFNHIMKYYMPNNIQPRIVYTLGNYHLCSL